MATFKPILYNPKIDGTSRIAIQMLHKRKKKIIPTQVYLTSDDLTRGGNIRSGAIKDDIEALIFEYRGKVRKLGLRAEGMTAEQIHEYLTKSTTGDEIDFFEYAARIIADLKAEGRDGTARNYSAATNTLKAFLGREYLSINEFTAKLMFDFAAHLKQAGNRSFKHTKKKVGSRAIGLYAGIFRAILNKAKTEFNDEDNGIIRVMVSPFAKFKIPADKPVKKRSLTPQQIRQIIDIDPEALTGRALIARDCFLLSFYMLGTNSADLYRLPPITNGRITYQRAKTKARRQDNAEISIRIYPEAKDILRRYQNKNGKYIFDARYSSFDNFNQALNKGLKQIGNMVGIHGLTFYAARHSWATIAANECKVDKYTIHQALNHTDETMRVTDMYINTDWSAVDRANRKVIDYILRLPTT